MSPLMDGDLPLLTVISGNDFSLYGTGQETFLDPHQLGHAFHGHGELLPEAEELIPVDGRPLLVHRGDLKQRKTAERLNNTRRTRRTLSAVT